MSDTSHPSDLPSIDPSDGAPSASSNPPVENPDLELAPIKLGNRAQDFDFAPGSSDRPSRAPFLPPISQIMRSLPALSRSGPVPPEASEIDSRDRCKEYSSQQANVPLHRSGQLPRSAVPLFNNGHPYSRNVNGVDEKALEQLYTGTRASVLEAGASVPEPTATAPPLGYGDRHSQLRDEPEQSGKMYLPERVPQRVSSGSAENWKGARGHQKGPCDELLMRAAVNGALESILTTETMDSSTNYRLGIDVVCSSKLIPYESRGDRLLPGSTGTLKAACYVIGGTPDGILNTLLNSVNPCEPRRDTRIEVGRVLEDKIQNAICVLNKDEPRDANANNLPATRICEVVADILRSYSSKKLFESNERLGHKVVSLEETIRNMEAQIKNMDEQLKLYKRIEDMSH